MKDLYIGKIVYIDDKTFTGRCKVKVFGLFDDLDDNFIPWFTPVSSTIFSSNGAGNISIPKLGDIVRVQFSNNDFYSGEYFALQYIDPDLINEIKDDYENTHVLLYDSGENLIISYQPMSGLKLNLKGSQILIDPTGLIQLKHQNNSCVIELDENDINITTTSSDNNNSDTTGVINISTGNTVNINANNVNVKANNINLGKKANKSAVIGEELQKVLSVFAKEIALKTPQGSALLGNTFSNILSSNIKISE